MDFDTRYKKLNAQQKQAVDTIDGPVMVVAGPGTGKTELLSMRAANILKRTDVLPENILCLTFTESGASAMRERLVSIIGKDAYKVAIHTFHSFGTEIINQHGQYFYHGANFRPADELSSYEIIRGIFDELEYTSPLAKKMNGEYTYLSDTLRTISELKRSGLTSDELTIVLDANDAVIDKIESQLAEVFAARISKSTPGQLAPILERIRTIDETTELVTIVPLQRIIAESLEQALEVAADTGKTTSVTAWKNTWLKKNEQGDFVFKSRERQVKLRALSAVYYQYLARMQEAELYDFDDMILRVVHAMEVFDDLRFNLQEKLQYIMVDEFQDTNMAQMRILHNLTDNPANEGKPNILVVGDDDQAIYSFQGAEIGNIINFRELYSATKLITLVDNYRSAPTILSHARQVITQGSDRLENHIPELDKNLTAHKPDDRSTVELIELENTGDEREWLARSIKEQLDDGVNASDIAVLARRHHEITALLPYLAHAGINVNYERRDNVLDLEIITHIELVSQLIIAIFESRYKDADALLPQLLAHPAWSIDPVAVWRLGLNAKQNHQSWIEVMAVTPSFVPLHNWLLASSQALSHLPLELMLDVIIGSEQPEPGSEDEGTFISPIFEYFFSAKNLAEQPDQYLIYLEALRTIRTKLREYRPNETPKLQSFIEFIRLNRQLGSTIESVRRRSAKLDNAVNLMTAHKSKGLEFDTVYVIGAVDNAWGERVATRSSMIGYPENLPLAVSGGSFDERLRLFFVAMTRAKRQLLISYSSANDSGKDTLRASFLADDLWQPTAPEFNHTIETLVQSATQQWYEPLVSLSSQSLRELLAPTLEHYKLSATDLSAFLDVSRGGPQMFLLQNMLRFPRGSSPASSYGTAFHATLQRAHAHLSATGKHRAPEDILHDFEQNLIAEHLSDDDFKLYLQKGSDSLQAFLGKKYVDFTTDQKAEVRFNGEHAIVGEAHLSGAIDLLTIDKDTKTIIVTDYKTGHATRDWKGKTEYDHIKLHKYRQQLMFYKLMVEHSRTYSDYQVERGVLQFVEPTMTGEILALESHFDREELATFMQLIQKVWQKITTLDLPDASQYDQSYKGILAFEQALLDDEV